MEEARLEAGISVASSTDCQMQAPADGTQGVPHDTEASNKQQSKDGPQSEEAPEVIMIQESPESPNQEPRDLMVERTAPMVKREVDDEDNISHIPQIVHQKTEAKEESTDSKGSEIKMESIPWSLEALQHMRNEVILLQATNMLDPKGEERAEIIENALLAKEQEQQEADCKDQATISEDDEDAYISDEENHESDCEGPEQASTKTAATRRPPAKTAREYAARLKELEAEKKRKRKWMESEGLINKSRKTSANSRQKIQREKEKGSALISSLRASHTVSVDSNQPLAPSIEAKTVMEQFAKLKASIPQGCDTRRAATQAKDLREARRIFGHGVVKPINGNWLVKGMRNPLKGFQLTAAAWMVKREVSSEGPKGGLLCDTMGMGKTIVSMAGIVGNPHDDKVPKKWSKCTLVVVPNRTVAKQWLNEFKNHCGDISKQVLLYTDPDSIHIDQVVNSFLVVLTTYKQVSDQYPPKKVLKELEEKFKDDAARKKEIHERAGPLFKAYWYRVILDEAHAIKNASSRGMMSCCALTRLYCWALSGTPLANETEEFYPYMKFIGCKFADELSRFKLQYTKHPRADANLAALVSMVMYRRTQKDTFMGHRILSLPDSETFEFWVPISTEESIIRDALNDHCKELINQAREGARDEEKAKQKETKVSRARLMILRQAISHPFSLERVLRQLMKPVHVNTMRTRMLAEGGKEPLLTQIQKGSSEFEGIARFARGLEKIEALSSNHTSFGGLFNMNNLIEMITNEHDLSKVKCRICDRNGPPQQPLRSAGCNHIYCAHCLSQRQVRAMKLVDAKAAQTSLSCLYKGCPAQLSVGDSVNTLTWIEEEAARDFSFKEPGVDSNGVRVPRNQGENGCFTASARLPHLVTLPPSSKLTATMAVILTWLEEAPADKIIVYTQFLMTGKVLGRMMEIAEIPFVYLFGNFSQHIKDRALSEFRENPEKKLISLQAGAQSLNLTVANRVILIDPWWNTTMEQQAFGRVVRIGQEKPSYWVKIMVRDSIDDQIAGLQKIKTEMVDRALQDDGSVPETLDDKYMKELFKPGPRNKTSSSSSDEEEEDSQ